MDPWVSSPLVQVRGKSNLSPLDLQIFNYIFRIQWSYTIWNTGECFHAWTVLGKMSQCTRCCFILFMSWNNWKCQRCDVHNVHSQDIEGITSFFFFLRCALFFFFFFPVNQPRRCGYTSFLLDPLLSNSFFLLQWFSFCQESLDIIIIICRQMYIEHSEWVCIHVVNIKCLSLRRRKKTLSVLPLTSPLSKWRI